MKKNVSIILFVCSAVVLIGDIGFCIYGVIDIHRTLETLAATPGVSGVDYLGIGWAFGIGLFGISTVGLPLSLVSVKLLENKRLRYCLFGMIAVFASLLLMAVVAFFV